MKKRILNELRNRYQKIYRIILKHAVPDVWTKEKARYGSDHRLRDCIEASRGHQLGKSRPSALAEDATRRRLCCIVRRKKQQKNKKIYVGICMFVCVLYRYWNIVFE